MHAVDKQLSFELKKFNPKMKSISSLFIGGGTPSTISPKLFEPFLERIKPFLSDDAEITSEANPNSATKEWLSGIHALGVNRLSFGVQSFNEEKLKFLGRAHNSQSAQKAIENAFEQGIKHISLDLIYGTALDTQNLLANDLEIASKLPIDHLSAYALTIEEHTPFFHRSNVSNTSEALAKTFVENIINKGFPQYEISNFGSYQSVHNKGYWEHQNYLGIGSGAVGFLDNKRFYPSKTIEEYLQNPLQAEIENLSLEDLHVEKIFLGLRSCIGIDLALFSSKERANVDLLIRENKLTCKEGKVYNKDYFLSDEIALYITQ